MLKIITTVHAAYGFVWKDRRAFAPLAAPAVVLGAGSDLFSLQPNEFLSPLSIDDPLLGGVVLILSFLSSVLFLSAWYRRCLTPERVQKPIAAYFAGLKQGRFLALAVIVFILLFVIYVLVVVTWGVIAYKFNYITDLRADLPRLLNRKIFFYIVGLSFLAITARFLLLFPAAATDSRLTVSAAWKSTKGHAWQIIVIGILTWIPFQILGNSMRDLTMSMGIMGLFAAMSVVAGLLAVALLVTIGAAVNVTAGAIIYRALLPPNESPPSNSPVPSSPRPRPT